MLVASLRLDLPTVYAPPTSQPLCAVLAALGLTPGKGDPAATVVSLTESDGPCPRKLVDNFPVANALRAGFAAGGGPVILVHLAAIAREAGVAGFGQMMRVLAAETPEADPEWLREYGVPGLLSSLGDALHDVPTVAGSLKENLPPAPSAPGERSRLVFIKARASGAEGVCRVRKGVTGAGGRVPHLRLRRRGRLERATWRDRRWRVARGGRLRAARRPWSTSARRARAITRGVRPSGACADRRARAGSR